MAKFHLRSKGGPAMATGTSKMGGMYERSGMTNADGTPAGPPFLGKVFKGIKKVAGNFVKGKGAFGALNPLGAIANKAGLFGGGNDQSTAMNMDGTNTTGQVNTAQPAEMVDPTQQQV